jgi:formyltetrahydrofolate deformylase
MFTVMTLANVHLILSQMQMVKCPDRKGVIASLATLLYGLGCNILSSEQFTAEVCQSHLASRPTVQQKFADRTLSCSPAIVGWCGSKTLTRHALRGMLQEGVYFQRIRFDLSDLVVGTPNTRVLEQAISGVAEKFGMEWRLFYDNQVKRVAILVSRMDHCLYDILIRHRAGETYLHHATWCCLWTTVFCPVVDHRAHGLMFGGPLDPQGLRETSTWFELP